MGRQLMTMPSRVAEPRRHAAAMAALAWALLLTAPGRALARSGDADDGPSMFSYGFRGFFTGAELGLATGFLATGPSYDDGEWRKLVLGAGIGAVVGVGAGVTLGIVDTGVGRNPRTGWLVLRDMSAGVGLGALTGAAVGALFWVSTERPKDVLTGMSWGALIGGAVGAVYGVVEGLAARPSERASAVPSLRLAFAIVPDERRVPALMPAVVGRF